MKKFAAKLKSRANPHVIVFDDDTNLQNLTNYVKPLGFIGQLFNPDISCDEDERYYVELSDQQKTDILDEYRVCINNSVALNRINVENYKLVECLYLIDDIAGEILFTKITNSFIIQQKKYIGFLPSGNPIVKQEQNIINFDEKVDAFYDGDNRIYFKNFSKVRSLFNGFSAFYSEATEQQKNEFLGNDFFSTQSNINNVKLNSRSLRKIAYINSLNIDLTDINIRCQYIAYANQYPELSINISTDNKLLFTDEKDVNNILDLLEENCYTTPVTGRKKVSQANKNI